MQDRYVNFMKEDKHLFLQNKIYSVEKTSNLATDNTLWCKNMFWKHTLLLTVFCDWCKQDIQYFVISVLGKKYQLWKEEEACF